MASLIILFPLKENDTLLTPPLTLAYGKLSLIHFVAIKKSKALFLCSSIPVATGNILGSKIISWGLNFTSLTNISYDFLQISILLS